VIIYDLIAGDYASSFLKITKNVFIELSLDS